MRSAAAVVALALVMGCFGAQPPLQASSTTLPASSSTTLGDEDFAYLIPLPPDETSTTVSTLASVPPSTANPLIRTFKDNGGPVCTVGGKPAVRMFGKRECEHCEWVGPAYDKAVEEYVADGRIVAYHWLFDRKDDALTAEVEGDVPEGEWAVFLGANQTTVPYFSFGCRFTRTGTGYFVQDRLDREGAEFRAVIEQLLSYPN